MTAVAYNALTSFRKEFLREIRARGLSAILIGNAAFESLSTAVRELGLAPAGSVPPDAEINGHIVLVPLGFTVRKTTREDVAVANALTMAAFRLGRDRIDRVLTPESLWESV